MPEPFADHLRVDTRFQKLRCMCVAEGVEVGPGEIAALQERSVG